MATPSKVVSAEVLAATLEKVAAIVKKQAGVHFVAENDKISVTLNYSTIDGGGEPEAVISGALIETDQENPSP